MLRTRLTEVSHGSGGRVVIIRGCGNFHRRLMKLGLRIGHTLFLGKVTPENNMIQVLVNGTSILLTIEEASRIVVEIAEPN